MFCSSNLNNSAFIFLTRSAVQRYKDKLTYFR